jgi:hypothetical protein
MSHWTSSDNDVPNEVNNYRNHTFENDAHYSLDPGRACVGETWLSHYKIPMNPLDLWDAGPPHFGQSGTFVAVMLQEMVKLLQPANFRAAIMQQCSGGSNESKKEVTI